MSATYHTRVSQYAGTDRETGDAVLSAYGELYGRVERRLFAEVAAGRSAASSKSAYLKRYGIPARMFNGVRVSLEGQGVIGQGAAEAAAGTWPGSADCSVPSGRSLMPSERGRCACRFTTRNGAALVICAIQAGWRWKRTLRRERVTAVLRVQAALAEAAPS